MLNVKADFKPFKGDRTLMFTHSKNGKIGHSFIKNHFGWIVRVKVLQIKRIPGWPWAIVNVKITKVYGNKKAKLLEKQLRRANNEKKEYYEI